MAAISNLLFRHPSAAGRQVLASAIRQSQEVLCALWMLAVLAFSLLLAVGFVV
jgi:hypothetical protein